VVNHRNFLEIRSLESWVRSVSLPPQPPIT
jgi:hypothetical protein